MIMLQPFGFRAGAAGGIPADWYDAAWSHRLPITLSGATGTNANFPVLITEANLGAHFFSNVKSDGSDIVVTASDGQTKLDRDLVSINTGSSLLELYARVPSLTSSSQIYLYYGNASGAETSTTATYRSDIVLFFPSGYQDNRTATASTDTVNGVLGATGKIGGAGDFDGVNDYNENPLTSFSATNFSVIVWLNPDSFASPFRFIGRAGALSSLGFANASDLARETTTYTLSSSFSAGAWEMLAVSNNGSGSTGSVYKGKSSVYSGAVGTTAFAPFDIGRGSNGLYYPGLLDHLILMNSAVSADFVSTVYDNTNNPSTFYGVGTREDI